MHSFSNDSPVYRQITDYLEEEILKHQDLDTALPSIRQLSKQFSVNPQTVLKSYADLMNREIVYKQRGMGLFVSADGAQKLKDQRKSIFLETTLPALADEAQRLGISPADLLSRLETYQKEQGHA